MQRAPRPAQGAGAAGDVLPKLLALSPRPPPRCGFSDTPSGHLPVAQEGGSRCPSLGLVGPVSCGHSFSVTSGWSARLSSKFVLLGSPHFCSAGYTVKKLISLRSYQKLQSARHFLPFGLFSVPIRVSGCWFLQHHFTCLLAFY